MVRLWPQLLPMCRGCWRQPSRRYRSAAPMIWADIAPHTQAHQLPVMLQIAAVLRADPVLASCSFWLHIAGQWGERAYDYLSLRPQM